jgi:hypothetical protein
MELKLSALMAIIFCIYLHTSVCTPKVETRELSIEQGNDGSPIISDTTSVFIDNNSTWYDTNGEEIKAQGGCIIQENNCFHWFGPHFESTDYHFRAINHYTSTDLKNWTKQSPALTPDSPDMNSIQVTSGSWVGRPWVMKHNVNDYVMWVEIGKLPGSKYRNRYGVFYASSLNGSWTFARAYESLPDSNGIQFGLGDLGAYHDVSTGNAYILYSFDKNETNGCQAIVKLSSDFRSVLTPEQGGCIAEFPKSGYYCREAAAIFKRDSTYYYTMSETRGWRPSDTYYRTARSIESGWSAEKKVIFKPADEPYSCRTQHDFVLPVTGSLSTTYIYIGDRWSLFKLTDYNNTVGRQAWFPISFDSNGDITINAASLHENGGDWMIDVQTGEFTY